MNTDRDPSGSVIAVRLIAFLALPFGFLAQLLLDGQVFTHAVFGICCGTAAAACGLALARKGPQNRWEGRIIAFLGLALAFWCILMLPSAYSFQRQFNDGQEKRKKMEGQTRGALWANYLEQPNRPQHEL